MQSCMQIVMVVGDIYFNQLCEVKKNPGRENYHDVLIRYMNRDTEIWNGRHELILIGF